MKTFTKTLRKTAFTYEIRDEVKAYEAIGCKVLAIFTCIDKSDIKFNSICIVVAY